LVACPADTTLLRESSRKAGQLCFKGTGLDLNLDYVHDDDDDGDVEETGCELDLGAVKCEEFLDYLSPVSFLRTVLHACRRRRLYCSLQTHLQALGQVLYGRVNRGECESSTMER
jgi:hypothetical protein